MKQFQNEEEKREYFRKAKEKSRAEKEEKKEKKKQVKKRIDNRSRNWTFLVYPESAVENWREVIDDLHVEWAESPLHDQDRNEDGTMKKPHWHVCLMFEGKKSYEQIKEITESVNGTIPQRVHSLRGMIRYFCHMDNPEKFQYEREGVVTHGGFEIGEMMNLPEECSIAIQKEMLDFIYENNIKEYFILLKFARHNNSLWFEELSRHSYMMINAIKSLRNIKEGEMPEDFYYHEIGEEETETEAKEQD